MYIYDSTKTYGTIPIEKNTTEFIVIDESKPAIDKVSDSPSNLSTTVASTNSESDNATGWGSSNSSNCKTGCTASFRSWNSISVADGEKLKRAVKVKDLENTRLANCLIVLQEELDKNSNELQKRL